MPVSPGYRDFVIEQLEHVATISSKSMFGGVGLYADAFFFALIAEDRLYFKVDDSNHPDFEAADMEAFSPYGDGRTMQYYEVPVSVLEDTDELAVWANRAVDVARRAKKGKKRV